MMGLDKRRKAGLLLIGLSLLAATTLVLTFVRPEEEEQESAHDTASGNVIHDVQDGQERKMNPSKSDAYAQHDPRRSRNGEYWDNLKKQYPDEYADEDSASSSGTKPKTSQELFNDAGSPAASPGPARQQDAPYRETPQEREARHQRRREEAIELAERMQGTGQEEPELQQDRTPLQEPERAAETEVRRTNVISSLESDVPDGGISTLGEDEELFDDDGSRPFQCMFSKDAKLKNGDRISVILLEDMVISGVMIPRHTHMMATCRISDRLELDISSIEISGRILALGYEAYDVDGSRGIYCPDVGHEGKTIRDRSTGIIGSSLNGRLGRMAGDVVSTGVSLLQGRDGATTVSVPAGYTFFIMKRKRQ